MNTLQKPQIIFSFLSQEQESHGAGRGCLWRCWMTQNWHTHLWWRIF